MKPTLKEIEDNYERVLLRLHSGELAGIVDDNRTQLQVLRKTHWIDKAMTTSDLDNSYNRKNSITDFNIDAIAFLSNKSLVNDAIVFGCNEIVDWDWDINNPHNLKFKKGDVVVIDHAENRSAYVRMLGKVGTIVDAEYTRFIDDERITYRVRVDDNPNEYQEQGLWVFHKEKSLKLYNPQCDDQMDSYEYGISTRTNWADILLERNLINEKGDNNNMEEITQIYMDRKLKKINDKFENLIENIKLNDERYKTFKQCVDTLDKLYKEDNVTLLGHYKDINLSEQTLKDIELLEKIRCEEEENVAIKIYEVRAQLSMCETYEQKQEILRRYHIINKNGKVNG